MNWLTCITCLFLALSTQAVAQNGNSEWPKADYQVVPLPSRITLLQKEDLVLNAQTLIVVGSDNVDMQRNGRSQRTVWKTAACCWIRHEPETCHDCA